MDGKTMIIDLTSIGGESDDERGKQKIEVWSVVEEAVRKEASSDEEDEEDRKPAAKIILSGSSSRDTKNDKEGAQGGVFADLNNNDGKDEDNQQVSQGVPTGEPVVAAATAPNPAATTAMATQLGREEVDSIYIPEDCQDPANYMKSFKSLVYNWKHGHETVAWALKQVGSPYGTQAATDKINERKKRSIFQPDIGMKVDKYFSGKLHSGEVIDGPYDVEVDDEHERRRTAQVWKVRYEDGDEEDYEYEELYRIRKSRRRLPVSSEGRPFHCLELFCGSATVSAAFLERKWTGK